MVALVEMASFAGGEGKVLQFIHVYVKREKFDTLAAEDYIVVVDDVAGAFTVEHYMGRGGAFEGADFAVVINVPHNDDVGALCLSHLEVDNLLLAGLGRPSNNSLDKAVLTSLIDS